MDVLLQLFKKYDKYCIGIVMEFWEELMKLTLLYGGLVAPIIINILISKYKTYFYTSVCPVSFYAGNTFQYQYMFEVLTNHIT
jgi:hypothetical protein